LNIYVKWLQKAMLETPDASSERIIRVLKKYRTFLERELVADPENIAARCQLAAVYMELQIDGKKPIHIMEQAIIKYGDRISKDDKSRLYTNLAYFYAQNQDQEHVHYYLKEAVSLKPQEPNADHALALYLAANADVKTALPLFAKAASKSADLKYQYNHAAALFKSGHIATARDSLQKLCREYADNYQVHYGYGVCAYYKNDLVNAVYIADRLANEMRFAADMDIYQVADLYYICRQYTAHNRLYDLAPISARLDAAHWNRYLYCLFAMGKQGELSQKYDLAIAAKQDELRSFWGEGYDSRNNAEKAELIKNLSGEINEITRTYQRIIHEGYAPKAKLDLPFMADGCYLLDCPRHQKITQTFLPQE